MIKRPPLSLRSYDVMLQESFALIAFDLSPKALRHSFAITKEATEQGFFIIGEGIQFPGIRVFGLLEADEIIVASLGMKRP